MFGSYQNSDSDSVEVGQQFFNDILSYHQCQNCLKFYKNKGTLQRHIKFECGKAPQFQCPLCPQQTKHKCNLMRHIKRYHQPNT